MINIFQSPVNEERSPLIRKGLWLFLSKMYKYLTSIGLNPARKGYRSLQLYYVKLLVGLECGVLVTASERVIRTFKEGFRKLSLQAQGREYLIVPAR